MTDAAPLRLEAERTEHMQPVTGSARRYSYAAAPWFNFDLWKEYLLEQGRRIVDVEVREYL